MSTRTFYSTTIPTIRSLLLSLRTVLLDGQKFAQDPESKSALSEKELVHCHLADMLPLYKQTDIIIAYLNPLLKEVGKVEPVAGPTASVSTFAELISIVDAAVAAVDRVDEATYNSNEDAQVIVSTGSACRVRHPRAGSYVDTFYLPNSFFHLTITYAALRQNGVPLGKDKYIPSFFSKDVRDAWINKEPLNPEKK